jgi:hypothetical protein
MRAAATGLVVLFVLFVWPTRYRYDRMQLLGETVPGPVYPVRIDRFTGEAEILLPQMIVDGRHNMQLGWVGRDGEILPDDALAELRASSLIDTRPLPYAQIFNATDWRITKIRWGVTSGGAAPGTRAVDQSVVIDPHAMASLYIELGRFGQDATIRLDRAWGVRTAPR